MSRAAGPLLLFLAVVSAAPVAHAADYRAGGSSRTGRSVEVIGRHCRPAVIETARYKEQVCRTGVSGYAYCRWVDRQHDVRVPETCAPTVTTEGTEPAKRGAFPPFPRG